VLVAIDADGPVDTIVSSLQLLAHAGVHELAPSLERCGCAIDADSFHTLLWAGIGPGVQTPKSVIDVTLVGSIAPYDVVIRGSAWADHTAEVIAARGKRVRFERMPLIGGPPQ
jgi:hypothetical protein